MAIVPKTQAETFLRALATKTTIQASQTSLTSFVTSAPSDASLAPGQFKFWLDATPGSTKLMVKAKDSGGTVRTGQLALS